MFKVPKEIKEISDVLDKAGFKAYLVGGCVRDILIEKNPKDWDIATDAKPEKIQDIFSTFAGATEDKPATVYENEFGTVAIKTESENPALKIIEVTTFRKEGAYTDKRRPDSVTFTSNIEDDLSRRDFTVNAIGYDIKNEKTIDPFSGEKDLKNKLLRAVGNPGDRFKEDALRLMRAIRLHSELKFKIEEKTREAIKKNAKHLESIAKERIRDELSRLIMTDHAASAIEEMEGLGLLQYVIPELREGIDVGQNKHHIFTVFEHNVRSLDYAAKENFSLEVRLAALLHDAGKPKTKRGDGEDSTFYGHQVVGARMAEKILTRLRYSQKIIEKVVLLVREHMFVYDPEAVTLKGVRRLLRRTGKENIDDLFKLREADRIGSGVPKAQPYRLRHLRAMIEKVQDDPISPKMLKINGNNVVKLLKIPPGPKVGWILSILLEDVLDDPKLNDQKILKKRLEELNKLSDKELKKMSDSAKESADEAQERIDKEIKDKYFVK